MTDDQYSFTAARNRLEEIVAQVRKKDVSLEHGLDLLEEGVRIASGCTELIDQAEWRSVVEEFGGGDEPRAADPGEGQSAEGEATASVGEGAEHATSDVPSMDRDPDRGPDASAESGAADEPLA